MSRTARTVEPRRKITPPMLSERWGVDVVKIMAFIRSGELRAINAASPGCNQRPRYSIDEADIADFERRREARPAPKLPPRRRRERSGADDYY